MRRIIDILTSRLCTISILLVAIMISGCATMNGLHPENRARNATVRWQSHFEKQGHVVR